jgi:hypothetical protein
MDTVDELLGIVLLHKCLAQSLKLISTILIVICSFDLSVVLTSDCKRKLISNQMGSSQNTGVEI